MEEVESLSSILESPFSKGEPAKEAAPPAVEPKAEPVAKAEEPKAPARDESGRFAKAEAKTEEPKAVEKPAEKSEPMVPLSALLAERARRKAPQEPAKPKADFWENPDQAFSERMSAHLEPLQQQNFALQLEVAKLRYADFDDAVMAYLKASQNDEILRYQADNAPDPITFIYREGKRIKTLEPYGGDFGKYSESITADLQKQLGAKDETIKALTAQLEEAKKAQAALESIPRSLNKGNEAAPRSTAEADDEDISTIVRFKSHG